MTKEEKIKDIYGNSFVLCSPDENGWSNVDEKLGGYEFLDNDIEYYDFECSKKWRPKSLSGIENNNGWIKIESEADLPTENGTFWILDKTQGIKSGGWRKAPNELDHKKACEFWIEKATHYQPIQKPEPPIY